MLGVLGSPVLLEAAMEHHPLPSCTATPHKKAPFRKEAFFDLYVCY
jgi:hypothetical protein